jgi:hypothetical protein
VLRTAPNATTATSASTDGAAVGELSAAQPTGGIALQSGDGDAATQVDAVLALQVGGDRADHPAQRAHQRRRPPLDEGDRQVALPAHRGDLGTGEPAADDQHPTGRSASRWRNPAASSRVRSTNTPSRAASAGLNQGRARVPVAISNRS